ncbi:ankyrin repeat, PH and SEC7 domain containing protein secG-like isoform X2 [Mya arenaria]|uniref:ankyrin repeat, PH and SEC7 domain containing protein secG-like isoform X2 n=1 Tax=Mya arenaria TaxID=6604 RepID=UPI0022E26D40|nr:ankyrin repeat, PH and SEC7 domain containing protein secG-like isoform X2 [Mya arenaria]
MEELVYKAICDDRPARLESFLRNGGDPNTWIEDSARISTKSFLHVCCEKGRIRCVKVLLENGAQVDIQGSWGQSPLMLCILVEYFDIAELLINNNPSIINQQDSSGNTCLHIAIGNDSVEGVELLLRYHADMNIMNMIGISPLMKICTMKESKNMHKIVELFIQAGVDIDLKDFKSNRTALQGAVLSKNISTVELLLNAGADPNSQDRSGRNALSNLIMSNLRLYEQTHIIDDHLMTIIHLLVMSGTDLDTCRYEGSSPLVMAIQFRCTPLVNYLLVNGASINGKFFGGITPLHHAVNKKDIETVKVLLNWSSDLTIKARMDKYNYDLLFDCFEWAILTGCVDIALLLVQAGYNASAIDYITNYSIMPPQCLQERPEILDELRMMASQPPSLFDVAVRRIRRSLRSNIVSRADQLPLPKLLIEDVKMRGTLC